MAFQRLSVKMVEFVDEVRSGVSPTVNIFTEMSALSAFLLWNGGEGAIKLISGDYFLVRRKFPENIAVFLRENELNAVDFTEKVERCVLRLQKDYEITVLPWFPVNDSNFSVVKSFFRAVFRLRKDKITKIYCETDGRLKSEVNLLINGPVLRCNFDDFEELEPIGQGNTSKVVKIRHKTTGETVAKKTLLEPNPEITFSDRETFQKLKNDRNIDRFFAKIAFESPQNDVLLQEFCFGGDLQQFQPNFDSGFHLSEQQIKRIIYHLTVGIRKIHCQKVAHGRLKIAKISLTSQDFDQTDVKITGFPAFFGSFPAFSGGFPANPFESDIRQLGKITAQLFYGESALNEAEFQSLSQRVSLRPETWPVPSPEADLFISQAYFHPTDWSIDQLLAGTFLAGYRGSLVDLLRSRAQRISGKCTRNQLFVQKHGAGAVPRLTKTLFLACELLESVRKLTVYEWGELGEVEASVAAMKLAMEAAIVSFASPQLAYI